MIWISEIESWLEAPLDVKDENYVAWLAERMRTQGMLEPIAVVEDARGRHVQEGRYRLAALKRLGKTSAPVRFIHR